MKGLESQDEEFELNSGGTGEPLKVLEREGCLSGFHFGDPGMTRYQRYSHGLYNT